MSKKKYNLNTIYISERLQENLKPISQSAFTAVTAPMGYGKTTAINWYLDKQSKNGNSCVIRISIYSDNLSVFWQSVQKAFAFAGLDFLDNYSCPSDAASAGMLADELCYSLSGQTMNCRKRAVVIFLLMIFICWMNLMLQIFFVCLPTNCLKIST